MESNEDIPQVGEPTKGQKTSPISAENTDGTNSKSPEKLITCWFNGTGYRFGDRVCSNGKRLICRANGSWSNIGDC